jgi:peptidoglycan/xylan/chitin deacetylase (PgdA/CDA1 family)
MDKHIDWKKIIRQIVTFILYYVGVAYLFTKFKTKKTSVLMYHNITTRELLSDSGYKMNITPAQFESQLSYINKNFNSSKLSEFGKENAVIITFDDGRQDNYTKAYSLLKKYKAPATFFLVANKIGKKGYLSLKQINVLKQEDLVDFGCHTLNHYCCDNLDKTQLEKEIVQSKQVLTKKIGLPINSFCFPQNRIPRDTERLKQIIFQNYNFSVGWSTNIRDWPERYRIKRIDMNKYTKRYQYATKLAQIPFISEKL